MNFIFCRVFFYFSFDLLNFFQKKQKILKLMEECFEAIKFNVKEYKNLCKI